MIFTIATLLIYRNVQYFSISISTSCFFSKHSKRSNKSSNRPLKSYRFTKTYDGSTNKIEFYFSSCEHCEGVLQYATKILLPNIGDLWWLWQHYNLKKYNLWLSYRNATDFWWHCFAKFSHFLILCITLYKPRIYRLLLKESRKTFEKHSAD